MTFDIKGFFALILTMVAPVILIGWAGFVLRRNSQRPDSEEPKNNESPLKYLKRRAGESKDPGLLVLYRIILAMIIILIILKLYPLFYTK